MSRQSEKLAGFLREVSNWSWDEFANAEKDKQYSSNEAIIFALIRACSMQQLQAIKIAVNRLDGKLVTPIKVEYPKIFYLFPNAGLPAGDTAPNLELPTGDIEPESTSAVTVRRTDDELTERSFNAQDENLGHPDLPSMGFRETLSLMSDYPRELPEAIVALALQTEQWMRGKATEPTEIPKVKSVVAAHLLIMAQNRNLDAITEVFDQIDGKLVETLQILGDDLYITSYASTAPAEALPNADGILQIEATEVQNMWAAKLGKDTR